MNDSHRTDELAARVAEAVRHALRLVGHAENGIERDAEQDEEPAAVS